MKCRNCGGDYRTRELKCPFCGTGNLLGKIWDVERSEAEERLRVAYAEKGRKKWTLYDTKRLLNRITLILFLISVIFLVAGIFVEYAWDFSANSKAKANMEEHLANCREYYDNGEYRKLENYLQVNGLYSMKELKQYTEIIYVFYVYDNFKCDYYYMLRNMNDPYYKNYSSNAYDENDYYSDFWAENLLDDVRECIQLQEGNWRVRDSIYPENAKIWQAWSEEALAFAKGTMKLTEKELELLLENDNYLSTDTKKEILSGLRERGAWDSWVQ